MKTLRSLLAIIGSIIVLAAALCSCSKNAEIITAENVAAITAPIMEGAEKYYNYISLGGLETVEYNYEEVEPAENGMKYVPVSHKDITTIAELKAAAEKIYTAEYAKNNLYNYAFDGEYPIYKDIDGKLCKNVEGGGGGGYTYVPDTAKLDSSNENGAVVTMDCKDNYGGLYSVTVTLKTVDGEYRIDNLAYSE